MSAFWGQRIVENQRARARNEARPTVSAEGGEAEGSCPRVID